MKRLLTIILTVSMLAALTGCGDKKKDNNSDNKDKNPSAVANEENVAQQPEVPLNENETSENNQAQEDSETSENKKPADSKPSGNKKPAEKEEEKDKTLGETLLSDFKKQADSGKSSLEIAEALMANPAIKFNGGAMPVEEGLLSGFDNAEIKGFKSGATFLPMIGSIAFVGYVFELENPDDASSFIANLRNNANLRWNVCVEAEEMITGSQGNKVFFVMCPKSLEG